MNVKSCAQCAAGIAVASLLTATGLQAASAADFSLVFDGRERVCDDFSVTLVVDDNTQLHENVDGQVFSTGALKVTAINNKTGKQITLNASGPTFSDGVLTGPALVFQQANFKPDRNNPFLIINFGRVTFNSDSTIATITGRRTDICAALA
jgi:hypothetical protein